MSEETSIPPTTQTLGEFLRSERERRNITIEQIASSTKISLRMLQALENDNYELLPAKPFVRGFVTSYVLYIGLPAPEILQQFDSYLSDKSARKYKKLEDSPHLFVDKEDSADRQKNLLKFVMIGVAVVALIAVIILKPSLKRHKKKSKDAISNEELVTVQPPPMPHTASTITPANASKAAVVASTPAVSPEATQETPKAKETTAPLLPVVATPVQPQATPTATASATPKPTPSPTPTKPTPAPTPTATPTPSKPSPTPTPTASATPAAKPTETPVMASSATLPEKEVRHRLVIRAVEDAWVKYQADDFKVMGFTLKKDKKIFIRARDSIRFTTGYAKGLEVSSNGIEFKPMDTKVKVLVVPQELESKYIDSPFVEAKTSTP